MEYKVLGDYINLVDLRNRELGITNLLGVSIEKRFIPSIANIVGTDLSSYKVVKNGQFAYGPVTSRNGEKISIALLNGEDCIISSSYTVFEVTRKDELDPEYLMLWFSRPEFDRYARYRSHGSVREIFGWDEMCAVELPIPDIEKQRKIVKAYKTITDRIALKQRINDNLDAQAEAIYKDIFVTNSSADWATGTLKDLLTVKYGKDHKQLADGNIPLYGSGGIMRYVERALYEKESVLVPRKGSLNNVLYVNKPFWSVDTMFYTEMKHDNVAKYVYYYIREKDLAGMDTGSAVPSMSAEIIHSMQLLIPDNNTLDRFERLLKPIFLYVETNTYEIEYLKALSQNMLTILSSR